MICLKIYVVIRGLWLVIPPRAVLCSCRNSGCRCPCLALLLRLFDPGYCGESHPATPVYTSVCDYCTWQEQQFLVHWNLFYICKAVINMWMNACDTIKLQQCVMLSNEHPATVLCVQFFPVSFLVRAVCFSCRSDGGWFGEGKEGNTITPWLYHLTNGKWYLLARVQLSWECWHPLNAKHSKEKCLLCDSVKANT